MTKHHYEIDTILEVMGENPPIRFLRVTGHTKTNSPKVCIWKIINDTLILSNSDEENNDNHIQDLPKYLKWDYKNEHWLYYDHQVRVLADDIKMEILLEFYTKCKISLDKIIEPSKPSDNMELLNFEINSEKVYSGNATNLIINSLKPNKSITKNSAKSSETANKPITTKPKTIKSTTEKSIKSINTTIKSSNNITSKSNIKVSSDLPTNTTTNKTRKTRSKPTTNTTTNATTNATTKPTTNATTNTTTNATTKLPQTKPRRGKINYVLEEFKPDDDSGRKLTNSLTTKGKLVK